MVFKKTSDLFYKNMCCMCIFFVLTHVFFVPTVSFGAPVVRQRTVKKIKKPIRPQQKKAALKTAQLKIMHPGKSVQRVSRFKRNTEIVGFLRDTPRRIINNRGQTFLVNIKKQRVPVLLMAQQASGAKNSFYFGKFIDQNGVEQHVYLK